MTTSFEQRATAEQRTVLSAQQRQGLALLVKNLPDLRQELLREMSANPVIDDIEPTLEKTTVSAKEDELAANERTDDYPTEDDTFDAAYMTGMARGQHGSDPEAMARREKFFENQTKEETLVEHLLKQLPLAGLPDADIPLAEMLIGELDEDGYFRGSMPDLQMVTGETEKRLRALLRTIMTLEPAGCGATTHQECLLAQLDAIADPVVRLRVGRMIERHWENIANGRIAAVERDLRIGRAEYVEALKALRTLDPRPGRAYRNTPRGVEYVNPEVHVERCSDGWLARVDARSVPEIRISARYRAMLEDPNVSAEDKRYVREKIAAAEAIREAVVHRQETIQSIAQAIFDAQPGFFEKGLKGLRPLTMQTIADAVGVNLSTVSRTVCDKYAATPKGTVELRKFFTSGYTTASGEQVTTDAVKTRLAELVRGEDPAHPLSDERLSVLLKGEGYPVERRTVAKYRTALGIPSTAKRRSRPAGNLV